jgi:hypothetical protein
MWGKHGTVGQATDDNKMLRMRFACCITEATNTLSEYVILIAFPRQRWLRQRATFLRYTFSACLVIYTVVEIRDVQAVSSVHASCC